MLVLGIDKLLVNFPARWVEDHNRQAWVIVEMSEPKRRSKFFAVRDRFVIERKTHLEAVEGALGVFHIEVVRLGQHPCT